MEDDVSVLIDDLYPVSPGHCLIIPKRHIESFFDLMPSEQDSLFKMANRAKNRLEEYRCKNSQPKPAGYNIGINDGQAAGQTVPHVHLHLIPRYVGDSSDPRGGVRWVLPNKAKYWSE